MGASRWALSESSVARSSLVLGGELLVLLLDQCVRDGRTTDVRLEGTDDPTSDFGVASRVERLG